MWTPVLDTKIYMNNIKIKGQSCVTVYVVCSLQTTLRQERAPPSPSQLCWEDPLALLKQQCRNKVT